MVFSPALHKRVASFAISTLPVFIALIYTMPNIPVPTVLTDQIKTVEDLQYHEKMQMLSQNNSASVVSQIPLVLHFVPHNIDLPPLLLLIALISGSYGFLSIQYTQNANASYLSEVELNLVALTGDTILIILDGLFWAHFITIHFTLYAMLMQICTLDAISYYSAILLFTMWGTCNRVVIKHPPALIICIALFITTHLQTVFEITQRNIDMWLPYVVFAAASVFCILCHTIDDILTATVVFNARISYVLFVNIITIGTVLYIAW